MSAAKQAQWSCYAQLQEGSFCTITVITAQTLTWAAAAGCRWMTVKPLPPDTPQGLHSSKQLSTLQQPAQRPLAISKGHAAPQSSADWRYPCWVALIHYPRVSLERAIQPSPEYHHRKVVQRHKQGRGGDKMGVQTEQSAQRSPRASVPGEYTVTISRC